VPLAQMTGFFKVMPATSVKRSDITIVDGRLSVADFVIADQASAQLTSFCRTDRSKTNKLRQTSMRQSAI
jgi:hypothetical protein